MADEYATGTEVIVHSLKARADLNERPGQVLGYDRTSGRYMVELPDRMDETGWVPAESVRARAANLRTLVPRAQRADQAADSNSPAAWTCGIAPDTMCAWLCDCYRMRCDDDCEEGCFLHGPCFPENTADSLLADFLVFARLAAARHVAPEGWDWPRLCAQAARLIRFRLNASDAEEKYGSEAAVNGERSLRQTAKVIYGQPASSHVDALSNQLRGEVARVRGSFIAMAPEGDGPIRVEPVSDALLGQLAEVGGFEPWAALYRELCEHLPIDVEPSFA